MAIETLDLPIKNGGSFHSYVSLPEGSGAHKPTYNWEGAGLVDSTIYHIFTKKIQKIFTQKKKNGHGNRGFRGSVAGDGPCVPSRPRNGA